MLKNSKTLTLFRNESLAKYSNFKIGGNAKLLAKCGDIDSLLDCISYAKQHNIKYKIIGGGTNILFDDLGFNGLIIRYEADRLLFQDNIISAEAGCKISKILQFGLVNDFGGYEFMCGVPTLLGGSIVNNFGAYEQSIGANILNVTILRGSKIMYLPASKCKFEYHKSAFQSSKDIILSADLKTTHKSPTQISAEIIKYTKLRGKTQPIAYPNCGSIFKREGEVIPAKLIDDANLKGLNVGDAEVSKIHSGFIINKGNAKCEDVLKLIELVKQKIFEKYDVILNEEIEYLPY